MKTSQARIPAFAFHESDDATITWGSSWSPGRYAQPEPVAVEYVRAEQDGLWVPRTAWVRGEHGNIDMHDCDWIESRRELCHHDAGGGEPYVNGWTEPERLPGRMWLAEGIVVYSADRHHRPLSDSDLLAIGIRRVHGPTPAPFEDACECGVLWCVDCNEYVPDDEEDADIATCCGCGERFHRHDGDLIVVDDEEEVCLDEAGVYRPTRFPFYTNSLLGCGYMHKDALERVGDLPDELHMDGYAAGWLCRACASGVLADRALPNLGSEWSEEPEEMPDERREALLDAVRSRADEWIAGFPEARGGRVHEWFARTMAPRFGLPLHEMRMLCEEAGYPA